MGSKEGSTGAAPCPYIADMKELLRTNDIALIAYVRALLRDEGIECFELDVNMSVLEGSIGILPRRIMVRADEHAQAVRVLGENDVALDG